MRRPRELTLVAMILIAGLARPARLPAQDQRDERFYLPGRFNWRFLATYPEAARLFNAFDYGHAVLYERLYTGAETRQRPLEKEYRYLTTDLLVRPPRFAVAEEAVVPSYARVAWRAKQMFDWAHVLHRQIYDVYSDERLAPRRRTSLVERLTDYYLSAARVRLRRRAQGHGADGRAVLQPGPSAARIPKFNGLIWAYHWLQVGLYEPYLEAERRPSGRRGCEAAVARFWSMLEDPPGRMPASCR